MLMNFCAQGRFLKLKPSHNVLHICQYWYISRVQKFYKELYIIYIYTGVAMLYRLSCEASLELSRSSELEPQNFFFNIYIYNYIYCSCWWCCFCCRSQTLSFQVLGSSVDEKMLTFCRPWRSVTDLVRNAVDSRLPRRTMSSSNIPWQCQKKEMAKPFTSRKSLRTCMKKVGTEVYVV